MIENCSPNAQKLPLVIEAKQPRTLSALIAYAVDERDFLRAQLHLCGALLFRGFEIRTTDEFRRFVETFSGSDFFNYAGGASPRSALQKNVYNSTEYPPQLGLELHNELSYSKTFPRHLYFFCETAPERGGATTLGDSRRILQRMRPEIARLFKDKGVLYERHLTSEKGGGYSWQEAFETDDRQAVEALCRATEIDFEWQANGGLRLRQICPATFVHPETGDEVWFNQAHGFHASALDEETRRAIRAAGAKPRLNSYFGDGSAICPTLLEHVRRVLREETVPHAWRRGDVLVLDNILTAHGRLPFSGARKIVLAMT
ncbi:MAG TPA: TauD/TfdA family dioxygenase [Pyrinomonadaceae bacterium]